MQGTKKDTSVFRKLAHLGGIFFALMAIDDIAFANPTNGSVVAGQATINTNPADANHLLINQTTDKAIINWQDFNIGANEHTQFIQPSSTSFTLNRVTGGNESQILGRLSANGRIMLINPAGIMFGAHSRVDVAGIVASTADISNANFLAGTYKFTQNPAYTGNVVNHGLINVSDTGFAVLVSPAVANHGVINARLGTVVLASGVKHTLDLYGDGLINFTVDEGAHNASVTNTGNIYAEGGTVLMTARAAATAVESVVNLKGYVEAASVEHRGDRIVLNGTEHRAPEIKTYANNRIEFAEDYRYHGDFDSYWYMFSSDSIDLQHHNVYANGLGGQSLLLTSYNGDIILNPTDKVYLNGGRFTTDTPNGYTYIEGTIDGSGTGGPQNTMTFGNLSLTGATMHTDATDINYNGTIDCTAPGNCSLTASAPVINFNGDIGTTFILSSLSTNFFNTVNINTANINVTGAFSIPANTINFLQSATINAGSITLSHAGGSAINSSGGNFDLTLNTSGGGNTAILNGAANLSPGGNFRNITTNADGTTTFRSFSTTLTGDLTFNNPVNTSTQTFGPFINAANINFNSTFDTPSGANASLTATGTINLVDAIGSINNLASLSTNAPVVNITSPTIAATGSVSLGGTAIELRNNLVVTSGSFSASTLNSDATPRNLTVNASGVTTFNTIGNTAPLATLTTDAAGSNSYSAASISANTFNLAGGHTLTTDVALNGNVINLSSGAFSGNFRLDLNQLTSASLTSLTGSLKSLHINGVGMVTLSGVTIDTTDNTMIVDSPIELVGTNTITGSGGGNVVFNNTVDSGGGGGSLTVNTNGTTRFNGLIGSSNPVQSIQTDVTGNVEVNTPTVRTISFQTFQETLTSNQSNIQFITVGRGVGDVVSFGNAQLGGSNVVVDAGGFSTTGLTSLNTFIRGDNGINGTGINITGNLTLAGNNGANLFGNVQGAGGAQAAINTTALGGGTFLVNSCVVTSGICFTPVGNDNLAGQLLQNSYNQDEEDEEDVEAAGNGDESVLTVQAEDDQSLYPSNYHDYLGAANNEEDDEANTTQTSGNGGAVNEEDDEEEENLPQTLSTEADIKDETEST